MIRSTVGVIRSTQSRRVRTRSEFSDGHSPAEVRFALSWVLGRDVLDSTDLDRDGTFLIHQRAPFCIVDFLNLAYFEPHPLIKDNPLSIIR